MRKRNPDPATLREVREWGRAHGYKVGVRGVIERALLDDFVKKTGRTIGRPEKPETR